MCCVASLSVLMCACLCVYMRPAVRGVFGKSGGVIKCQIKNKNTRSCDYYYYITYYNIV